MGNEDLGAHFHAIGDLPNATKAFARMRDCCTTPAQIASTAFRIMLVAVEQANWLTVQSQIHKIRNLQMKPDDAARIQPKMNVAQGLYQMCTGDYRDAAFSFITTDPSLGESYNEVMTSNDVAVYGGLCALASMTRAELQAKVLESTSFRTFLELEPHIRRTISFFCASKYGPCLDILESYRADYLLDIYLQPHVNEIYSRIRTTSIVQYFQPFSRVTLASMETTFGGVAGGQSSGTAGSRTGPRSPAAANGVAVTASRGSSTSTASSQRRQPQQQQREQHHQPSALTAEIIRMIETGKLNAKIDLEAGVLIADESETRADVHEQAAKMVEAFIRQARLKILRVNAVNAGIRVEPALKKAAWAGSGAGRGAGGSMDLDTWEGGD